jgi:hypothetical protein
MKNVEKRSENLSSVIAYLEEQSALVRAGGYWNCLVAARRLAELLLTEGRSPWIARLRKTETRGEDVFHVPLIPRRVGVSRAWTTHYVCCCDEVAYDPVAGKTMRLDAYSQNVFNEQIPMEVFVAYEDLAAYLANPRLL